MSYQKDLMLRRSWNEMSLTDLWSTTYNASISKSLGYNNFIKIKELYFNQNIIHRGISKEEYFKHPLRMLLFAKKYFLNHYVSLFVLICFHNILEVTNIKTNEIENKYGKTVLKHLMILTIDRKRQKNKEYLTKYYSKIVNNKLCYFVKLIDKYDNLFDLSKNNSEKIKRDYLKEIEFFMNARTLNNNKFKIPFIFNVKQNKRILNA